mmetsp:Transcript_6223/g.562  ORF Transcript_6223/g.562 Transcript_6223/m.562 type:complete len:114 (-) Transcript_6223:142-483(-)
MEVDYKCLLLCNSPLPLVLKMVKILYNILVKCNKIIIIKIMVVLLIKLLFNILHFNLLHNKIKNKKTINLEVYPLHKYLLLIYSLKGGCNPHLFLPQDKYLLLRCLKCNFNHS